MNAIKRRYEQTKEFTSSVIQWRSTATAPYLMILNSAFWWCVFYLKAETQLRLLISLAACIFGWDILLSSSHEHSVIFHLISWPVQNTLRTASVIMALLSAQYLHNSELEKACWTAYATVGLLTVNPVWHYQKIPQRMGNCVYTAYDFTKEFSYRFIVSPLIWVFYVIKYIVLFEWFRVVVDYMKETMGRIENAIFALWTKFISILIGIWNSITNSILTFLDAVKNCIFNAFFAVKQAIFGAIIAVRNGVINTASAVRKLVIGTVEAIRQLIVSTVCAIKRCILSILASIKRTILTMLCALRKFVVNTFRAVRQCIFSTVRVIRNCIYSKVTAIRNAICNGIAATVRWIDTKIAYPVRKAALAVGRFLRYWFCAYWWPDLRAWLKKRFGVPLQRAFNYFCYGLVYIFCGYWMDPLQKILHKQIKRFSAYMKEKMRQLYGYTYRTVLLPLARWTKARLNNLIALGTRTLHRLAVAIRDSVLWPFCLLIADAMKQLYGCFHALVIQPIYDYLYEKYKIGEDYVLINILAPACKTIIDNIPERSPFCDDTDTELAELLPEDVTEDGANESGTEGTSDRPSLPSRSISPLTEDEHDFVRGLKFPAIEASESSDEEFDLKRHSQTVRKKMSRHPPANTKAVPKDPTPPTTASADALDPSRIHSQNHSSLSATSSQSEGNTSSSSNKAFYPELKDELVKRLLDIDEPTTSVAQPGLHHRSSQRQSVSSSSEASVSSFAENQKRTTEEEPLSSSSFSKGNLKRPAARSTPKAVDADEQFELLDLAP